MIPLEMGQLNDRHSDVTDQARDFHQVGFRVRVIQVSKDKVLVKIEP
jgi:hypothetical protein